MVRVLFLVQLKREDQLYLIDPEAFLKDLRIINDALADAEWLFTPQFRTSQAWICSVRCPNRLFDTELGARLAGLERVNLGATAEELLGYVGEEALEGAGRAALPESWLNYALLDVDVLIDLRVTR